MTTCGSVSTRTVNPDRGLPELGPALQAEWETWLARHGLPEPRHICAGGPIVCDDDARTVSAFCKIWNDNGHDILVPTGDPKYPHEILKDWITVQLEAPALPLPGGYPVDVS